VLRDCEAQLRCKDGSIRHVLLDSNALLDNGKLVHTRCFTRDVTDRKEAEKIRARLAAIVESSDDAIISKDLEGIIQTWNHSAERMFGYAAAEAIGRSITLIVPPERMHEEREILQALRRGENREHFHTVRVRKDGTLIQVSLSISPIRDHSGKIVGASNISRDVTDSKRAEAALRESEERFRTMASVAPVMIWMSGLDKHCNYFNQRWLEFTGRTLEQEIGNGWAEGVHPDDLPRCLKIYTESFDQRQTFEMDYRLRRADGEFRWISDHGVPRFTPDGTFLGYIGSCIDITERREAEEVIRRSRDELETRVQQRTAQLARANEELRAQIHERRQLEALVLSISEREQQRIGQDLHDGLCQQLTGIKFRNKLLEQKLAERGVAEAEDAQALEALLNQAVEQARSQARGLNPVRLEADGLTTALEELAGSIAAVFDIKCVCATGKQVLLDDHAVAIHLYRIAQEAITNAIKHGKARTVRLQLAEENGHVRLTIHDDGIGLRSTASKNGGTGLHIMNYRARTIGAALDVRRSERGGTLVTCSWPKRTTEPATKE
jgi:PAS domain S-box-containing protein